jgi:uroporphyrinogen-III synthase
MKYLQYNNDNHEFTYKHIDVYEMKFTSYEHRCVIQYSNVNYEFTYKYMDVYKMKFVSHEHRCVIIIMNSHVNIWIFMLYMNIDV